MLIKIIIEILLAARECAHVSASACRNSFTVDMSDHTHNKLDLYLSSGVIDLTKSNIAISENNSNPNDLKPECNLTDIRIKLEEDNVDSNDSK